MKIMKKVKRETTEGIGRLNLEKYQEIWIKRKLQVIRKFVSGHSQTEMNEKNKKTSE